MKIIDDKISIGRGHSNIEEREYWTSGDVYTPHGIVSVYAQGDDKSFYVTWLKFVANGFLHIRIFHDRRYSPRGIVTKAKQFAAEITS